MTHQAQRRAVCGRHVTHAFLLPVCASSDFGKKPTKDNLLVGGGGGKIKKICFVWVLVSSSQCNGVFNYLLKPHYHFPWYVITQRNLPF